MKNLLLTTVIVGALLAGQETKAQIGFNVNVHVRNRPLLGVPGTVIVNEPRSYVRAGFYRQQYGNRYNTYRRQDVYAQRNIRPEYRNDNRYDQRGYNDRFNQGRNDERRNERFDNNRNDQRNSNDRGNQGRIENNRMENNRIENSRIDQRGNDNHGNQDRNNGQRPDTRRNEPVLTAPQKNNDYKDEYSDNRGENVDQNRNVTPVPGQIRTAQRRGQ